jgi:hypothetical protein
MKKKSLLGLTPRESGKNGFFFPSFNQFPSHKSASQFALEWLSYQSNEQKKQIEFFCLSQKIFPIQHFLELHSLNNMF